MNFWLALASTQVNDSEAQVNSSTGGAWVRIDVHQVGDPSHERAHVGAGGIPAAGECAS